MNNEIQTTSKKTITVILIICTILTGIGIFLIYKIVDAVHNTNFLCIKSSSFTKEDAYNHLDERYDYNNFTFIERVDEIKDKNVIYKKIHTGFKFKDNNTGQYFYVYWKVSKSEAFHCTEYEDFDTLLDSIIDYYIPKFDNKIKHNNNEIIDFDVNNYSSFDEMVSAIYNFREFLRNNVSKDITYHLYYGINTGERRIVINDSSFDSINKLKEVINEKISNSY